MLPCVVRLGRLFRVPAPHVTQLTTASNEHDAWWTFRPQEAHRVVPGDPRSVRTEEARDFRAISKCERIYEMLHFVGGEGPRACRMLSQPGVPDNLDRSLKTGENGRTRSTFEDRNMLISINS